MLPSKYPSSSMLVLLHYPFYQIYCFQYSNPIMQFFCITLSISTLWHQVEVQILLHRSHQFGILSPYSPTYHSTTQPYQTVCSSHIYLKRLAFSCPSKRLFLLTPCPSRVSLVISATGSVYRHNLKILWVRFHTSVIK